MSERWTQDTAEVVALAMAAHHLDPDWTDADRHSRCVCEGWVEGEMEPGWDDHMADVALTALADLGLLVEPGGGTREEESWSHSDGTDCIDEDCYGIGRHRVLRTVTEWPNGNELITPWRAAQ